MASVVSYGRAQPHHAAANPALRGPEPHVGVASDLLGRQAAPVGQDDGLALTGREVAQRDPQVMALQGVSVILPLLEDIGGLWARGTVTVGQEHLATTVIAGRLHALAREWDAGVGPRRRRVSLGRAPRAAPHGPDRRR